MFDDKHQKWSQNIKFIYLSFWKTGFIHLFWKFSLIYKHHIKMKEFLFTRIFPFPLSFLGFFLFFILLLFLCLCLKISIRILNVSRKKPGMMLYKLNIGQFQLKSCQSVLYMHVLIQTNLHGETQFLDPFTPSFCPGCRGGVISPHQVSPN